MSWTLTGDLDAFDESAVRFPRPRPVEDTPPLADLADLADPTGDAPYQRFWYVRWTTGWYWTSSDATLGVTAASPRIIVVAAWNRNASCRSCRCT
jgi:hypothetical protein